MKSLDGRKKIL